MGHKRVIAIAVDPGDRAQIYAGVEGGGVFALRRGGGRQSWARLEGPPADTVFAGAATDTLRARVWIAGLTEGVGANPGVSAELGFGPHGADPAAGAAWTWTPARFLRDSGAEDEYGASVVPPSAGTYDYCLRLTCCGGPWRYADLDGTSNGYSTSQAGSIVALGATGVEPPRPPSALALRALGNPGHESVLLELDLPRDNDVEITLFDSQGRQVATLARGRLEAGAHRLKWDGRDARGNPVKPGVYVARVAAVGGQSRRAKLVILK
jgi:hypothetical protein